MKCQDSYSLPLNEGKYLPLEDPPASGRTSLVEGDGVSGSGFSSSPFLCFSSRTLLLSAAKSAVAEAQRNPLEDLLRILADAADGSDIYQVHSIVNIYFQNS